jgi:hypothetical protein
MSAAMGQPARLCVFLILMVVSAGCGSGSNVARLPLEGTIHLGTGETLNGSITFVPAEGRPGPAATTAVVDGKYRFDTTNGPTAGEHRVIVKRIISRGRIPDPRASSQKTDSKSVTNPAGKVEWSLSCNLKATDAGPRDFTLEAE